MKELVAIKKTVIGTEEVNSVNARELHIFLENKDHFATWIKDMISQYAFVENQDFVSISELSEKGRPKQEYHISIDMAKEISMVENNEKGEEIRKYFIQCEKALKEVVQNKISPHKISPQWQCVIQFHKNWCSFHNHRRTVQSH